MSNNIWADDGLGGPLKTEVHYNGRKMLCFSERPPTLAEMLDDLAVFLSGRQSLKIGSLPIVNSTDWSGRSQLAFVV